MADGETIKPVPDLTLTLDPAEFFGADLSRCPDWPVIHPLNPAPLMLRPEDAEKRIEAIRAALHPGNVPLREPSAAERQALRERYFSEPVPLPYEISAEAAWRTRHGMAGLRPRDPSQERRLDLIVEACHIWGFIEKRRLTAEKAVVAKKASDQSQAEKALERAVAGHAEHVAELGRIAEAAERHRQAREDERAFIRAAEITRNVLPSFEAVARDAAKTLGIEPPTFEGAA